MTTNYKLEVIYKLVDLNVKMVWRRPRDYCTASCM